MFSGGFGNHLQLITFFCKAAQSPLCWANQFNRMGCTVPDSLCRLKKGLQAASTTFEICWTSVFQVPVTVANKIVHTHTSYEDLLTRLIEFPGSFPSSCSPGPDLLSFRYAATAVGTCRLLNASVCTWRCKRPGQLLHKQQQYDPIMGPQILERCPN